MNGVKRTASAGNREQKMKILIDAHGRAPNPRRVKIFMAEKGMDITYERVDLGKQEQKKEGLTKLNPLQRVPVLILDDGTVISESIAICRYFEEVQPEPNLMGQGAAGAALVEMWQRRMELNFLFHVAQTFRHSPPAMKEMEVPQVPSWGEANPPHALRMISLLDAELASRPFIAGSDFSVADITALVATDFMKVARIDRPDNVPNFDRWHTDVSSRPSASA